VPAGIRISHPVAGDALPAAALAAAPFAELRRALQALREARAGAEHRHAEGIDLAYRDAAGWLVVDFKTDQELGERSAVYGRQVTLYVRAISAATGLPARGVLLRV
jgi:ATP-dependent exoDNAse (exonuclease V) beta subunit